MGAKARVTDVDLGYREMFKRLRQTAASPGYLTVGIHEMEGAAAKTVRAHKGGEDADAGEGADEDDDEEDKSEPLTLLEVAAIHEFGLGVPRRSFIADWADENRENHYRQLLKMAKAIVKGKVASLDQAFERLGNLYVGEVQKRIAQGIEPPLAQSTIDRKGSSKPLIDTGQLRSSIRYRIGKPGGGASRAGGGGGGEGGGGGDE